MTASPNVPLAVTKEIIEAHKGRHTERFSTVPVFPVHDEYPMRKHGGNVCAWCGRLVSIARPGDYRLSHHMGEYSDGSLVRLCVGGGTYNSLNSENVRNHKRHAFTQALQVQRERLAQCKVTDNETMMVYHNARIEAYTRRLARIQLLDLVINYP